ncbi:carbohydrate-binding protein [Streptomyces sp. TRM68367]|uniref:rhamnogalacturonan lyase family protein n=1 Tax=Streptomyces sp. TRM68367 TaxID=2758415 RepID=UPI00165C97BB|nr:carbohydrate-binding protein [Streptomyces sp. TRM68367]MBC9731366.1 carbohydrate-binding protein [Streptomyces sp. TRM68367]
MRSSRRRVSLLCAGLAAALAGAGLIISPTVAAAAAETRYEAETAPATCDGTIDTNHSGYSGTGFCNGDQEIGAAAQFTVNAPEAGTATLRVRFANGSTAARAADVDVNGTTTQSVSFQPTGAWSTWTTTTSVVQLNSGDNTIRLNPTSADGLPNIDYVELGDTPPQPPDGKQLEDLDRGLVSVRSGNGNLVSWRMLGTDPSAVSFHLYRGSTLVFAGSATNYYDSGASSDSSYTVRAVVDGAEQPASAPSVTFANGYLDVPIQRPSGGGSYSYRGNDASVGDLDGDGVLEIVLKWNPSNAKDNAQEGHTGNVLLDAYRLNGERLWRIDLGRNIRAGAHYTQFQVYDYDGDGSAEVAMKTADGTRSGTGQVIGNGNADHRNSDGRILSGPEFLTVFRGTDGAILDTDNYDPPRGNVCDWGDCYGNRVDRFLAGTAYLDGERPSIIMARGYYTRSVIAAWDFRGGQLAKRWVFDSDRQSNSSAWAGKGNHQLSIADADGDGRDEVMYGSIAIDDSGRGLWQRSTHHGDAYHVGDLVPSRPGLEVFSPTEWSNEPAHWVADARTGGDVSRNGSCGCDNGRGVAADVWAGNQGAEIWSAAVGGLRSAAGNVQVAGRKPGSTNFLSWWDGDPVRELLDRNHIDKYGTGGDTRLLTASDVFVPNGSKATPALSGDILGDWREEVIWPTDDQSRLRIYSTPHRTDLRLPTLLHDPQYRVALAWQNTAYNQPPHPSFFLGNGMSTPPRPDIYVR